MGMYWYDVDRGTNVAINLQERLDNFQMRRMQHFHATYEKAKTASEKAAIQREFEKERFVRKMRKEYGFDVDLSNIRTHSDAKSSITPAAPAPGLMGFGSGSGSLMGTTGAGGGEPQESLIEKATKFFYDEKNNGVQYSNIVGGIGGGALAVMASNYMVSAAGLGGGWLGTIATFVMAGAGIIGGSQAFNAITEYMQTPKKPPAPLPTTEPAKTNAKSESKLAAKDVPEVETGVSALVPENKKTEAKEEAVSALEPENKKRGTIDAKIFREDYEPALKGFKSVLMDNPPASDYVSLPTKSEEAGPSK